MQSGHNLQNAPTASYKPSNIQVIFLMTQRPTLKSYKKLQTNSFNVEVIRDEKVVTRVTPFTGFALGERNTGEMTTIINTNALMTSKYEFQPVLPQQTRWMSFINFFIDWRLTRRDDQPPLAIFGTEVWAPTGLTQTDVPIGCENAGVAYRDKILQDTSDSRVFEVVSSVSARYSYISP